MSLRKNLIFALCIIMAVSVFSACGSSTAPAVSSTAPQSTAAPAASQQAPTGPEEYTLPIADGITITYFIALDGKASATRSGYGEIPAIQELMKRTGINIEFKHPAGAPNSNEAQEAFNLMIASGDLTDLVASIPNSANHESLVERGLFLDLAELIPQYCPSLMKLYDENPGLRKDTVGDSGIVSTFPASIRLEPFTRHFESFMIRQDWLDVLDLEKPTTIDQWYTVLTAIKTGDPNRNGVADEIPFVCRNVENLDITRFTSAWGINACWFLDFAMYHVDGDVRFGLTQPEYKEFLETMNKWYSEGLIDPDYLSVDAKGCDALILNDIGAAFYGKANGHMGTYLGNRRDDPSFDIRAAEFPIAADGKAYDFGSQISMARFGVNGTAVNAKSKYVTELLRLQDYLYSEEGNRLVMFGEEGVTYDMIDGKPVYTELITSNPEGLSVVNALGKYTNAGFGLMPIVDADYFGQVFAFQQQHEVFPACEKATMERKIPSITLTPDESREFNSIMGDIKTYCQENESQFIMGMKSLDEFDSFVARVESMNIARAVEIYQAAYNRYQQR